MNAWKYRSKGLLKSIFCHQKSDKKADRLCMTFSSTTNTSVQRCLYAYFKSMGPLSAVPSFLKIISTLKSGSAGMVNKHTVHYHPSPSQLTLRIHLPIFLWTPKGFITPESFLNFSLNLCILPWLRKSLKFMVLKLLANKYIFESKNWICQFLIMLPSKNLPQVFIITP